MKLDNYENAVKDSEGNLENFTLAVGGKDFVCECGCNVLHKPNKNDLNIYKCNCCNTTFKKVLK